MKRTELKRYLQTAVLAGLVLTTFAANGGRESGGGHLVEAGIKRAAIELATSLKKAPLEFSKLLKFDINEFYQAAYTFIPSCAVGEDLIFLKEKRKLAYVKEEKPKTVLLDCEDSPVEASAAWKKVFSRETDSKIFVAHEVLRTLGAENEDSYSQSGSIALMDLEYRDWQREELSRMITTKNLNRCRFKFKEWICTDPLTGQSICTQVTVILKSTESEDDPVVSSKIFFGRMHLAKSSILQLKTDERDVYEIVRATEELGCFNK